LDSYMDIAGLLGDSAHQHATVVATNGGLIGALFLAGLVGGFSHCAGMCGPFVFAQVGARLESMPACAMGELRRLTGALLLPYHLGRTVTYAGIGGAAAFITASVSALSVLRWLSAVLLVAAALFFLVQGLQGLGLVRKIASSGGQGWWARAVGRMAARFAMNPSGLRGLGLGLVLGLLPCGLLYGAVAAAAASADPFAGAVGMAAFSAGTVPSLFAVAYLGQLGVRRWRQAAAYVIPLIMFLNAGLLAHLAFAWVV
jgi:sulfite exporter TauE/SafE